MRKYLIALFRKVLDHIKLKPFLLRLVTNDFEKLLLSFAKNGFLYESGWIRSFQEQKVIDKGCN